YPPDLNDIKVPSVVIDNTFSQPNPFQIGPGREDTRQFSIDIWGRSKGDRDDIGEMVKNFFYGHSMPIYDYNDVLEQSVYTQIGLAWFESIRMFPTRHSDYPSLA